MQARTPLQTKLKGEKITNANQSVMRSTSFSKLG